MLIFLMGYVFGARLLKPNGRGCNTFDRARYFRAFAECQGEGARMFLMGTFVERLPTSKKGKAVLYF